MSHSLAIPCGPWKLCQEQMFVLQQTGNIVRLTDVAAFVALHDTVCLR